FNATFVSDIEIKESRDWRRPTIRCHNVMKYRVVPRYLKKTRGLRIPVQDATIPVIIVKDNEMPFRKEIDRLNRSIKLRILKLEFSSSHRTCQKCPIYFLLLGNDGNNQNGKFSDKLMTAAVIIRLFR
ncbi:unnamed protein product, partial [Heterotrigona itama]